jgi:hypothetical protein
VLCGQRVELGAAVEIGLSANPVDEHDRLAIFLIIMTFHFVLAAALVGLGRMA